LEEIAKRNNGSISKGDIFKKKAYSGELSVGAIKRMSKAINLLVASSVNREVYSKVLDKTIKHKLSFVTLTIPTNEKVTAKKAHKELLEPFIKWLRQNHNMKSYVWKLELQKRGQIHYHITSDVYVHHSDLRNKWNQLLFRSKMMNEYVAAKGDSNANSTDIHSVRKVKDLSAYLIKYFTKKEQNPVAIEGKLWDCSLNLKKANYYTTELTQDLEYDIYKIQEAKECKIISKEKFAFVKFRRLVPISIFPKEVKAAYYKNLEDIRNYSRGIFECIEKQTIKTGNDLISGRIKIVPKYQQLVLFN
jgi:hypothetical protein